MRIRGVGILDLVHVQVARVANKAALRQELLKAIARVIGHVPRGVNGSKTLLGTEKGLQLGGLDQLALARKKGFDGHDGAGIGLLVIGLLEGCWDGAKLLKRNEAI